MKPSLRLLLIDDDEAIAVSLKLVLQNEGYDTTLVTTAEEGLRLAEAEAYDVVLTDVKLPGMDGLALVAALRQTRPYLPIIVMTAHGTTETAIRATKLGAFDYLLKPFDMEELIELLAKAIASARLRSQPVELGDAPAASDAIVGNSRQMQMLYKEIGRIAPTSVTVLIRGETGTGKELLARAIYQHSDRAQQPFIAVNCAAIPETLLESELFGHERGAFTGADARRIGRFEQADQGTIFLDEIGELNQNTQGKLLRVLQERTIQRVGGKETIPVNIRIIAATHRNLEEAIATKEFRQDLFYRLSVVVLHVPPLRERTEDIPMLVRYFLQRHSEQLGAEISGIGATALELLQSQSWPGNVRELENVVCQAMLLARGPTLERESVAEAMERINRSASSQAPFLSGWLAGKVEAAQRGELQDVHAAVLGVVERELLAQAMQLAGGNLAKAARWLGVSRLTLRQKLQAFGLRPPGGKIGE
jgi:nitrogen regulation protein NR(I)